MNDGSYNGCDSWINLGIENPALAPNSHFTYNFMVSLYTNIYGSYEFDGYLINAKRTTLDHGDTGSYIALVYVEGSAVIRGIHLCGKKVFQPGGEIVAICPY